MDSRPKSNGSDVFSPVYEAIPTTTQPTNPVVVHNNYGTIHGNVMANRNSSLNSSKIQIILVKKNHHYEQKK